MELVNNNDKESFQKYIPDHIDKEKAWDIITSKEEAFSKEWWKDTLFSEKLLQYSNLKDKRII